LLALKFDVDLAISSETAFVIDSRPEPEFLGEITRDCAYLFSLFLFDFIKFCVIEHLKPGHI